jgi:hypothetical protein
MGDMEWYLGKEGGVKQEIERRRGGEVKEGQNELTGAGRGRLWWMQWRGREGVRCG